MKSHNINDILQELSDHILEIKKNPEVWKSFILKFIESKPHSEVDESFRKELRNIILQKVQQTKTEKRSFFWMWPILSFCGGAALTALILLPLNDLFIYSSQEQIQTENIQRTQDVSPHLKNQKRSSKDDNLNVINISTSEKKSFGTFDLPSPVGTDESINLQSQTAEMSVSGRGGGALTTREILPMPPYGGRINYEYVYDGSLPEMPSSVQVYKKKRENTSSFDVSAIVDGFNMGGMDITPFQNLEVENITLSENREKGYRLSFDVQRNHISLHQDWERWQPFLKFCEGINCVNPPITKEDVPRDEDLIAVADDFLAFYNIQTHSFGQPSVLKYWEQYSQTEETQFYPETMTVIYPYLIEGKEVYQQYGKEKIGLRVQVNIRLMEVTALDIESLSLEQTSYETIPKQEIRDFAFEGGFQGVHYRAPQETRKRALKEPEQALMQLFVPQKDSRESTEIITPVLVFSVDQSDQKDLEELSLQWGGEPDRIIVPLAKDLFLEK